jgi:biotin-(acetyl-CoA carboxylase) ligase
VQKIGDRLAMLESSDPRLPELWRARSILTGRRVKIVFPLNEIIGVVESIADDGALVVATTSGVERCYGGVVAEF